MVHDATSADLFRWIMRSSTDGLWIFDESGVTTYANDRMAGMLGRSPQEMPGLAVAESLDGVGGVQFLQHLATLTDADTGQDNLECSLIRKDGTRTWALASHSPLVDDHGVRRGWLHRLTEVPERDRPSDRLVSSEQQLVEAQAIAMIGSWEWDLVTNVVTWSDELYRIFELPQEFEPTYERFMERLHPEDRASVDAALSEALGDTGTFSFDARINKLGGDEGWIRGRGRVTRDEDGAPVRMGGTCQGITDAVVVAQGQAAERDAAMDASRRKSDFLATMSHEIRTPINGVVGLTDLLLKTGLSPDQERLATSISLAGQTLLGLVNDILDLSKIEAGKLELEVVDFEVRTVVEQVLTLLAGTARVKSVALVVEHDANVPRTLRGDPVRFGQVVTNLVANAVKFTHHGQVTVRVAQVGAGRDSRLIRVTVVDTGIGVALEAQGRLFESFTQADPSTTREYGGSGLGLSIASRLVEALGGEIGFTSEPGVGSTFWFSASFRPVRGPHAVPDLEPPPGAAMAELQVAPPAPTGTVLVVEDNEINQIVARGMLEGLGYAVEVVHDGLEAVAAVTAGPGRFAAVLMDCQMPRLDGYEATRVIRQLEEPGVRVPIIAMTASNVVGEEARCLDAGMDGLLVKPVGFQVLESTLLSWIAATAPLG